YIRPCLKVPFPFPFRPVTFGGSLQTATTTSASPAFERGGKVLASRNQRSAFPARNRATRGKLLSHTHFRTHSEATDIHPQFPAGDLVAHPSCCELGIQD
ncbi:unnamed protein product, partial [Owenia fusiformis]